MTKNYKMSMIMLEYNIQIKWNKIEQETLNKEESNYKLNKNLIRMNEKKKKKRYLFVI